MPDFPTLLDVLRARQIVRRYLRPTPLHHSPALSALVGTEVYVKYENHHAINVFKIRGPIYLLSRLSPEQLVRGVVTASTGNHGQGVAYAARLMGVQAIVYMPENANPDKVESMRYLGAEVRFHGADFDEGKVAALHFAQESGAYFIHPAHPDLIAGVGTMGLEIFEDLPDTGAVVVPIGLGSSICGNAIVAKSLNPGARIVGVQAEKAPAVALSILEGRWVETERCDTFAEGMATRMPTEPTLSIMRELVDEVVLVSEEELCEAIVLLLEKTHNLAEGAGAASLAASLKIKDRLRGRKVVLILSGGNLPVGKLKEILNGYHKGSG